MTFLLLRLIFLFVEQIRDTAFDTNAISSDNAFFSNELGSFIREIAK